MRTYFLGLVLVASTANAQLIGDNFIEITVSDTVPAKIKNIVYEVTPADPQAADVAYDENTDYDKVMRETDERAAKAKDKLSKEIVSAGYKLADAPSYGDPYTITAYDTGTPQATVRVSVTTDTELRKLVAWLRQHGNVEGHIAEWNYDPQPAAMEGLMTGLYNKARTQASTLASLGGRKLGKLITAHDPEDREMTFRDFMGAMRDIDKRSADERSMPVRQRQMVFRFALTD